jgi:hypothetical protein|tara:strand:- start:80 stop:325 length:246 start_codon:yes stop_codon:yes gene_type:complete
MGTDYLFAIDFDKKEVIISESLKGTNKIKFIERIKKDDNEIMFNAVITLNSITKSRNFDTKIFKSMDKVCQAIYDNCRTSK